MRNAILGNDLKPRIMAAGHSNSSRSLTGPHCYVQQTKYALMLMRLNLQEYGGVGVYENRYFANLFFPLLEVWNYFIGRLFNNWTRRVNSPLGFASWAIYSRQRSLSSRFILPRRERPLLAGKATGWNDQILYCAENATDQNGSFLKFAFPIRRCVSQPVLRYFWQKEQTK